MSGFDRVLFRGSPRRLTHSRGMKWYLAGNNILCKQYQDHVKDISQKLKKVVLEPFQRQNLLVKHVFGCDDKDKIARAFAAERGIREGDVCALTTMEMAPTFQHYKTDLAVRTRPCPTIYQHRLDPQFGWMHARIQTWFPFYMHVCINGREWLSRRMDREGLRYVRQENCFPWVEDIPRAQPLFQAQLQVNWSESLQPFARRLNPLHEAILQRYPTQHGMPSFSSPDVLHFLGHRINPDGQIPRACTGELTTDFKSRASGERVKYRISGNSLKGYGKASTPMGDLYRVETLTQHVEVFKTCRGKEGGAEDDLQWRTMRRGAADMHRRCEVSQKANERYWDALSTVDDSTRFSEFTRALEQPCHYQGRRVRAPRLFHTDDHKSLKAINHGEFTINGLRNRDLQLLLYAPLDPNSPLALKEKRRRSAAVSRKLRILRAHGLIQKIPKTHRYRVTSHGRLAITAILTMHRASIALLNKIAA